MPTNRSVVRKAIANSLRPALPTARDVYSFMYSKFSGKSPIVRLMNAGANRPEITEHGVRSIFYYTLQFWVVYFEEGTEAVQAEAEDILDQLELEWVTWLGTNQVEPAQQWTMLGYDKRSTVETAKVSGKYYIVESIPLAVEVYG